MHCCYCDISAKQLINNPIPFVSPVFYMVDHGDGCRKSVTLRISSDLLDCISCRAQEKKMSLNALANQILQDYDEWHARAIDAGMTYVSKALFSQLTEELTDDQLRKIAELYADSTVGKELVILVAHGYDLNGVLHTLRTWFRNAGFTLVERVESNNRRKLIVQHGMGTKCSILISGIMQGLLKPLVSGKMVIEIAGSTVILTITT